MLSKLWMSLKIAFQNIRSNLLHTLLSTLGIVIGVAALVTILSLIDGMEHYAREQITSTTSLNSIVVESRTRKQIDGVWVDNPNVVLIRIGELKSLNELLGNRATAVLRSRGSTTINEGQEDQTAAYYYATSEDSIAGDRVNLVAGIRKFEDENSALVSLNLAKEISVQDVQNIIGKNIKMGNKSYIIKGILESDEELGRRIALPLISLSDDAYVENPPKLMIDVQKVEEVETVKKNVEAWLNQQYDKVDEQFNIYTNQMRVEQARKGMLLFKIIMGLITGVAVVVGGIGVMNVLLISVTERTVEIGIRKATGAKKFDIVFQFLSESITVSILGSALGLLLGMVAAMATVPIVKYFVDVPFEAGFSISTMIIIAVLAVCIGIIFGTYPALRAANLTPVEAIRRE